MPWARAPTGDPHEGPGSFREGPMAAAVQDATVGGVGYGTTGQDGPEDEGQGDDPQRSPCFCIR